MGIKDKTKEVIGLRNILEEEERIANAIADSVSPFLIPSLQLHTWRDRDLLLISVPHSFGPYYIKSKGVEPTTYALRMRELFRQSGKNQPLYQR